MSIACVSVCARLSWVRYRALTTDPPGSPSLWSLIASVARDEFAGFGAALRPFVATKTDVAMDPVRKQVCVCGGGYLDVLTVCEPGDDVEQLLGNT